MPEMVYEIEDICQSLHWPVNIFEPNFPDNTFISPNDKKSYGIIFTPTECEPVFFVFDSTGRLWNPFLQEILSKEGPKEVKVITVHLNLDDDNPEPVISEGGKDFDVNDILYQISVKTQNANPSTHIQILELIRYLSDKYLADFNMTDDSGYWETGDVDTLNKRFYSAKWIIQEFHEKLSEKSFSNPEEFIKFIKHLGSLLKKSLKEEEEE